MTIEEAKKKYFDTMSETDGGLGIVLAYDELLKLSELARQGEDGLYYALGIAFNMGYKAAKEDA